MESSPYTHTHTLTHIRTHAHTHTHTQSHTRTHTHAHIRARAHTHTHTLNMHVWYFKHSAVIVSIGGICIINVMWGLSYNSTHSTCMLLYCHALSPVQVILIVYDVIIFTLQYYVIKINNAHNKYNEQN